MLTILKGTTGSALMWVNLYSALSPEKDDGVERQISCADFDVPPKLSRSAAAPNPIERRLWAGERRC